MRNNRRRDDDFAAKQHFDGHLGNGRQTNRKCSGRRDPFGVRDASNRGTWHIEHDAKANESTERAGELPNGNAYGFRFVHAEFQSIRTCLRGAEIKGSFSWPASPGHDKSNMGVPRYGELRQAASVGGIDPSERRLVSNARIVQRRKCD